VGPSVAPASEIHDVWVGVSLHWPPPNTIANTNPQNIVVEVVVLVMGVATTTSVMSYKWVVVKCTINLCLFLTGVKKALPEHHRQHIRTTIALTHIKQHTFVG
jgi:hypothetical protein